MVVIVIGLDVFVRTHQTNKQYRNIEQAIKIVKKAIVTLSVAATAAPIYLINNHFCHASKPKRFLMKGISHTCARRVSIIFIVQLSS